MNDPLLLLPGMMCDARLFGPQIEAFSKRRAVMVAPLCGAVSIAELASAVLDDAPPRFALAGLSMGGIVAMEIVAQASERTSRLCLMDTNPYADTPERRSLRQSQIERVKSGELRQVIQEDMKPNYLADGPEKGAILQLCMQMAEDLGADVFVEQSRALQSRPDQTGTLRSVAVPTLLICGEHDSLCPHSYHEAMRDLIPDARLVVVPNAGHLTTLEQPELCNKEIRKWLLA